MHSKSTIFSVFIFLAADSVMGDSLPEDNGDFNILIADDNCELSDMSPRLELAPVTAPANASTTAITGRATAENNTRFPLIQATSPRAVSMPTQDCRTEHLHV